jgi:hypothetical protein
MPQHERYMTHRTLYRQIREACATHGREETRAAIKRAHLHGALTEGVVGYQRDTIDAGLLRSYRNTVTANAEFLMHQADADAFAV